MRPWRAPTPTDQNFLNFMQFFGKIWQIYMLAPPPGGLAPPPMRNHGSAPVHDGISATAKENKSDGHRDTHTEHPLADPRGRRLSVSSFISVADPGFPQGGGANSPGGRQHTILPNFPKNCMKLKEFGSRGGGRRHASLTPPTLDLPLHFHADFGKNLAK